MTAAQKLLLAVADAVGFELKPTMSEREMAITCWKAFPDDFGIVGQPEWPDTKRFSSELYKWHGSLSLHLRLVARGRYSLTVEGIKEAERLRAAK